MEITSHKPQIEIKLKGYNPIWIDVKSYAKGIGGWRTMLIQLLHLASNANITNVEL